MKPSTKKTALLLCLAMGSGMFLAWAQDLVKPPESVSKIIRSNCTLAGCHTGSFPAVNMSLEPALLPGSILNRPSQTKPGAKIIDITAPEKSYLLAKILGGPDIVANRMPLNRPPLAEEDIRVLHDWILSLKGAEAPDAGNDAANGGLKKNPSKPDFWGVTVGNLPTGRTIDKGRFLFRISHRFYPSLSSGFNSFFGLDGPSYILIAFGYGISDRLTAFLGRTNFDQVVEAGLHWRVVDQDAFPVSAALHVGGSLVTAERPGRQLFDPENRKLNVQLSLSRRLTDRVSLVLVPSITTNADHWAADPQNTLALGLGGRWMILDDISLIGEFVPVLSGYKNASTGWGFGLEKKVGGHVFQFFATNSLGATTDLYLPGGDLRLGDGDLRLGFNIYRLF